MSNNYLDVARFPPPLKVGASSSQIVSSSNIFGRLPSMVSDVKSYLRALIDSFAHLLLLPKLCRYYLQWYPGR